MWPFTPVERKIGSLKAEKIENGDLFLASSSFFNRFVCVQSNILVTKLML